ncbi:glycosyltransferase [Actinomadura kijaniata]|uniref:glycosyltransferase n=1 Tax=Actinomadura kijaniata TaxID=46161 RepID=UPI00082CCE27|nr:glycosyltransferase [Actinomadura kijaniata]
MSPAPRIAVIVTTVGRPRLLDRLLLSLAGQTLPPARVVVVDRGRRPGTAAVVEHRSDRLAVHHVTAPGGTSAGRNAGLVALGVLEASAVERPSAIGTLDAMLGAPAPRPPAERTARELVAAGPARGMVALAEPDGFDVVLFPGDHTWYPPDALERGARALEAGADVVSGRMVGGGGARPPLGERPARIDDRNVWTLAPAESCFFRASFLRTAGGFDEGLGAGCDTPWQSGATADLLLRGLRAGSVLNHAPDIRVFEHDPDAPPAGTPEHGARARHAARGAGRVHRRHYGGYACARAIARPLGAAALAFLRRRRPEAALHLHRSVGHLEGLTGALLPAPPPPAPPASQG